MDMQLILRIVGIVLLVIAALFAVLAVHYYVTRHIRAVMDDLSGKARAQGVAQVRRDTAAPARGGAARQAHDAAPAASAAPAAAPVRSAAVEEPAPLFQSLPEEEDGSGTVLVASAFNALPNEDDLATIVEPEPADEDDLATEVAAEESAAPASAPATSRTNFRLTRRIVLIHSQDVIASSEESLA